MANLRFFITGVGRGLGRGIAEAALGAGHAVVGTVRTDADRRRFEELRPGAATGAVLDVTDFAALRERIERTERDCGPIDVLVNNAGYGVEGTIEEASLEDLRRQFETNVFAPVAAVKAVLPFFRARRRGHIINVTSMGGMFTTAGVGFYHASKFALEGITGSLAKEVAEFGIRVTALAPGSFRTEWAGRSLVRAARAIPDYDSSFDPLRAARIARSGKQPGDPRKAGEAVLRLVASENPPAHLLLGNDALAKVRSAARELEAEIAAWEGVTRSTDHDDVIPPAGSR